MAFTGTPTILKISDGFLRITGLSLAAAAAGTIGLVGGAGEIDLIAPEWKPYATSGPYGGQVGMNQAITVEVVYADAAATTTEPLAVVTTGASIADFLATITNRDAAASGAVVLNVRYHQ